MESYIKPQWNAAKSYILARNNNSTTAGSIIVFLMISSRKPFLQITCTVARVYNS